MPQQSKRFHLCSIPRGRHEMDEDLWIQWVIAKYSDETIFDIVREDVA